MIITQIHRLCVSGALFCCLVSPRLAGQIAEAGLSPVPLWPRTGIIPQDMLDQHVFLDLVAHQIVVSYTDDRGVHKLVRFDQENQAALGISAAVTPQAGGGFIYDYTIQNGGNAKRSLREWTLIVGAPADQLTATHASWNVDRQASTVPRPGSIRPEMAVTWSTNDSAHIVTVGSVLGGFRVVSGYKPGLTLAYGSASVSAPYTAAASKTLPPAVADQMTAIINPTWNAAQVLTVGPKYSANDPKELIVMDSHRALNQLMVYQLLKTDSPFASAAVSALETFMQNTQSGVLSLDFLGKAAPGLESEIAAAMAVSLP